MLPGRVIAYCRGRVGLGDAVDGNCRVGTGANLQGIVFQVNIQRHVRVVPGDALRSRPCAIQAEVVYRQVLKAAAKCHIGCLLP